MKKSTYISVLKESLMEADTTKTSDILGPMVEPILGYDGNGELKTHKSAADILKKYYFEGEGNEGESVVEVNDPDTVTSGEKDQKEIDGVKKRVEDIITSTTQTDQPTEKTLKEMVVDLEEILFEESDDIDEDIASNLESLLEDEDKMEDVDSLLEDDEKIKNIESLLEDEENIDTDSLFEADDIATTAGEKRDQEEEVDDASKDVIIDKSTKTKLESILMAEDEEVTDEDEKEDEDEDENPLDVDKELKESDDVEVSFTDKLSAMLNEDITDNEYLIDNIESIISEQTSVSGDITGIDSPFSDDDDNIANDIDEENPMHTKVTTEGIEDSVLEWLIMEIEDTDMIEDENISESDELLLDDDDDFKVSEIKSNKIRV